MKITSENKDSFVVLMNGRVLEKMLFITYTSSSNPPISNIPFKVVEKNYKLEDNFKIELVPMLEGFAKETLYVSDFKLLLHSGYAKLFQESSLT